ncbi:flagellar protein FlgN [Atrimonas thermophila]|uniref:flagellar protein FlgN n=1 Tax=Atrimonas thermophila TaxID=3064161 RepID=UPI00399C77EE
MSVFEEAGTVLLEVLKEGCTLQKKLLEVVREEQEILIQNRIGELGDVVKKKADLILENQAFERKLTGVLRNIASFAGLEEKETCISQVLPLFPEEIAISIKALQNDIWETSAEVQRVNQQNAILIKDTLNYFNAVFALLARIESYNSFEAYDPSGKRETGKALQGILIDGRM